jgi:hypothetical protein
MGTGDLMELLRGKERRAESLDTASSGGTMSRISAGERLRAWARETWAANRLALEEAFIVWLGFRIILSVIAVFASAMLPLQEGLHYTMSFSDNIWLDVWARWDSEHYISIAQYGYEAGTDAVAFFPLYPLLMALVAPLVGGDEVLAGVLLSSVASFTALFYLFKLADWEFGRPSAKRALLYMAIYPLAFYMLAIYTESLFLTLSIAAFYYARQGKWGVVIPLAFFSGLTRPTGVLLLFPLAYEVWRQSGVRLLDVLGLLRRVNWWGVIAAGAAPFAWVLWAVYLGFITNDPFIAFHSTDQPPWWRSSTPPWETLATSFEQLGRGDLSPVIRAVATQDLLFAILLIETAIVSWFVLPRAYAIYCTASAWMLLSFTVHNSAAPMLSIPRYTLAIFPIFFLLAKLGANEKWDRVIVIVSATLLGIYTAMFATWYWVF